MTSLVDVSMRLPDRPATGGSTTNSTKDNSTNDGSDNEQDNDVEDEYRDPPVNYIRFRPSAFKAIPPTVFIEYPPELKIKRTDANVLELQKKKKLCYKSPFYDRICIKNAFKRAGFEKLADNDSADDKYWTALWSKHQSDNQMRDLNCLQKINHFPDSWCVGRKDRLNKTMHCMRRQHGKEFDYHPEGYILPNERDAFERKVTASLSATSQSEGSNLWIMKPRASSCGRGIRVITSQQALQLDKAKSVIMQKYLHDPYLIDGRKFDLRIYVLVTGVDPLRVYVHREGLTRISTGTYSLKNIKNRFAHLTNYSINKKSKQFKAAFFDTREFDASESSGAATDAEREGYKWSLHAFKRWLSEREGIEVADQTFEKIYDLCVKTCIAAESYITPKLHSIANYRSNCFELFGLDVILDTKLQPYLLEVNVSPSLNGSSPLDKKIKGTLIADILHTVGLYAFDKSLLAKYDSNNDTPLHGATLATATSASNPFTFSSLSTMMGSQDTWRKNQHPENINLKMLDKNDSAWLLLLMSEDEMARSTSTQFRLLHPTSSTCVHYNRLYKNQRFSDHLLAKWVLEGQSSGASRGLIPPKFIKDPQPCPPLSKASKSKRSAAAAAAADPLRPAATSSSFAPPSSRPASAAAARQLSAAGETRANPSAAPPALAAIFAHGDDKPNPNPDVERYNLLLLKELSLPTTKFSRFLYEKHSADLSQISDLNLTHQPPLGNSHRSKTAPRQRMLPQIPLPGGASRIQGKSNEPLLLSSRSKI